MPYGIEDILSGELTFESLLGGLGLGTSPTDILGRGGFAPQQQWQTALGSMLGTREAEFGAIAPRYQEDIAGVEQAFELGQTGLGVQRRAGRAQLQERGFLESMLGRQRQATSGFQGAGVFGTRERQRGRARQRGLSELLSGIGLGQEALEEEQRLGTQAAGRGAENLIASLMTGLGGDITDYLMDLLGGGAKPGVGGTLGGLGDIGSLGGTANPLMSLGEWQEEMEESTPGSFKDSTPEQILAQYNEYAAWWRGGG